MKIYLYFGGRLIFRSPYIPKFTVYMAIVTSDNCQRTYYSAFILYFVLPELSQSDFADSQGCLRLKRS